METAQLAAASLSSTLHNFLVDRPYGSCPSWRVCGAGRPPLWSLCRTLLSRAPPRMSFCVDHSLFTFHVGRELVEILQTTGDEGLSVQELNGVLLLSHLLEDLLMKVTALVTGLLDGSQAEARHWLGAHGIGPGPLGHAEVLHGRRIMLINLGTPL